MISTCTIRGRVLDSGGLGHILIRFTPARNGIDPAGRYIAASPVVARSTDTGAFQVDLIPSDVVGPYEVRFLETTLTIHVPRERVAQFADLLPGTDEE